MQTSFRSRQIAILLLFIASATGCATQPKPEPIVISPFWTSNAPSPSELDAHERLCWTEDEAADDVSFLACMASLGWQQTQPEVQGVVVYHVRPRSDIRSRVNVRARPSTASQVLAKLPVGQEVVLLAQLDSWYRVRLQGGSEGYVSRRWMERVPSHE